MHKERINITVDKPLLIKIREYCKDNRISISGLFCLAIERHLAYREEKEGEENAKEITSVRI